LRIRGACVPLPVAMRQPRRQPGISNASQAEASEHTSACLCEAPAIYASCYAGGFFEVTFASNSLILSVSWSTRDLSRQRSLVKGGRSWLGLEGKWGLAWPVNNYQKVKKSGEGSGSTKACRTGFPMSGPIWDTVSQRRVHGPLT
jgi:hypothetical protein